MFEDKSMFKFVCVLLGVTSIILPGPIVPIIGLGIAIAMLVYKVKRARESPDGFQALMIDIVLIVIVLIINIGFFAMRISLENEYRKYDYSSSRSQDTTAADFADMAIITYQMENFSQFSDDFNHKTSIKNGFVNYLKNELNMENVNVNGDRITCSFGTDTIIFTVTKNNIKYSVYAKEQMN